MKVKPLNAALALALLALNSAPVHATVLTDNFTFQTAGQSLWATGGQARWSYDSGFIGGTWGGGFSASSPVTFGLNGITGSANALIFPEIPPVQISPYIPAITTPAIPPQQITPYVPPQLITPYIPPQQITPPVYVPEFCTFWPIPCVPGYTIPGTYTPAIPAVYSPAIPATYTPGIPSITTPAVPAVFSPAVPAVYGDTRTGGSAEVKTSGALGFNVKAAADGGGLGMVLPYQTMLTVPDRFVAGQLLRVGGSGNLINNGSASLAVDAPSFNGSVNGIINTTNKLSGTGCFIGAGCDSAITDANIDKTIAILAVDTTKAAPATALDGLLTLPVVLGQDLPITVGAQTVGHVTISAPTDKSGGSVYGNTLRLDTNETLLRTTADFGGIAQLALGVPIDVLQPSIDILGVVSVGATVLNLQGGVNFGLSQALSFEANVDVTLTFDQDMFNGQGQMIGKSITFDLGSSTDIMFAIAPTMLSYSYAIGSDSLFTNDTSISVDPLFAIKAGCVNLSVAGGVLADIEECAFDKEFSTTNLVQASVYNNSFEIEGFNTFSRSVVLVPEPNTYAMLLAGLAGLGFLARRRAKKG